MAATTNPAAAVMDLVEVTEEEVAVTDLAGAAMDLVEVTEEEVAVTAVEVDTEVATPHPERTGLTRPQARTVPGNIRWILTFWFLSYLFVISFRYIANYEWFEMLNFLSLFNFNTLIQHGFVHTEYFVNGYNLANFMKIAIITLKKFRIKKPKDIVADLLWNGTFWSDVLWGWLVSWYVFIRC